MINSSPASMYARVRVQHGTLEESTDLLSRCMSAGGRKAHGYYAMVLSNGSVVNLFWREVPVDDDSVDLHITLVHGREG